MVPRTTACLVAAGLLTACIHEAPKPLDLTATAARLAARSLASPEVAALSARLGRQAPAAGDAWGPDDLVVAAWALRAEVAAGALEVVKARGAEEGAGRRQRPALSLTPEFATHLEGAANPWTIALALAWPFELGGKREARQNEARAATAVALGHFAETLWAVRQEVVGARLELELAARELALAHDEVAARRELAAWVETLLRLGAASQPERQSALLELAKAEAARRAAATAELAARGRLATALALPLPSLDGLSLAELDLAALPAAAELAEADLAAEAVANRLDLHRAVAEYAVAEGALASELARQVPDLTLGPGLTFDQGQRKLVFGAGLTLPDPVAQRLAIRQALLGREQVGLAVERVQAAALAATAAASAGYAAAQEAVAEATAALDEGRQGVALAEKRLALGAGDRGEVLTARALAGEQQRALITAQRAAVDAVMALEAAVERPVWPPSTLDLTAAATRLGDPAPPATEGGTKP